MKYETTLEIEIAVAKFFNSRRNLIVPNVSWGMLLEECDLLILTRSGYIYEVEIKVSKYDLSRDKKKKHNHNKNKTKRIYFAIPNKLKDCVSEIPIHAGIIVVGEDGYCEKIREATETATKPLSEADRYQIARLGAMRIWGLKEKILKLKIEIKNEIEKKGEVNYPLTKDQGA